MLFPTPSLNSLSPYAFIASLLLISVRHTDLPCRMVFRKYGTQLAYTSMIDSDRFIAAKDRTKYFSTAQEDRPLIAQFGATNAEDFVRAAEILQDSVDAVCLNMDCPQRRAAQQGFGAYLMKKNEEEVLNIVRRAKAELKVPVVAKIRLLSLPATVGNGYKRWVGRTLWNNHAESHTNPPPQVCPSCRRRLNFALKWRKLESQCWQSTGEQST